MRWHEFDQAYEAHPNGAFESSRSLTFRLCRCSCLLLLCRQFFRGERRPARKSDHEAIRAEIDSRTSNLAPEDRLQGRRQLLCEGVPRPPTNFRRCILRAVEKDWPAGVADVERQFVLIGMTHSRDAEGRPGVSTRPWLFGSCDLRLKIYGSRHTRRPPIKASAPFNSRTITRTASQRRLLSLGSCMSAAATVLSSRTTLPVSTFS